MAIYVNNPVPKVIIISVEEGTTNVGDIELATSSSTTTTHGRPTAVARSATISAAASWSSAVVAPAGWRTGESRFGLTILHREMECQNEHVF
jgi:hypothetical protein